MIALPRTILIIALTCICKCTTIEAKFAFKPSKVLSVPSTTTSISRHLSRRQLQSKEQHMGDFVSSSFSSSLFPCLSIRGGGGGSSSDYDSDSDSDFDFSDDDLFGLDDMDVDNLEDDFSEQSTLSLAYQAFQKSPPLTKIYLTASFLCSGVGYLQNNNVYPSYFLLDWKPILKGQIWRPITAFFNFGPLGLGWLMTAHFVWTYMSTLERLNHNKPYEFWYMIFFGCTSMVCGYTFLNISPRFLGHNLSTFLVYVWSRYHEGLEVNMFEMFHTRAEMLPWFFLAQTFLLEGEFPILDLLGIAFGHVYHYLASVGGIGRCPGFVKNWYEKGDDGFVQAVRAEYKKISNDFEMQ